MQMKKIIISDRVFDKFPLFKRGLVIVSNLENTPNNKRIKRLLDTEIARRKDLDIANTPEVKVWEEAHRNFGSDPNKFFPSVKSLLQRIKTIGFPFINSVVGTFNYISLKYLVPCGGDDVNKIEGDLCLDLADGAEIFIPLGSQSSESPEIGEVIYLDSKNKNVMCRRWNWRNGDKTKILPETKKIVINIDGIGHVSEETIKSATQDLAEILKQHCKAELYTDFLDINKRFVEINL